MIRHIVMFTLAADTDEQRDADIAAMRSRLLPLVGPVDGLRSIVLEPDLRRVEGHWDVVLVSEHDSNEALEGYQVHPMHREAAAFINSVTVDRATVDYEF